MSQCRPQQVANGHGRKPGCSRRASNRTMFSAFNCSSAVSSIRTNRSSGGKYAARALSSVVCLCRPAADQNVVSSGDRVPQRDQLIDGHGSIRTSSSAVNCWL